LTRSSDPNPFCPSAQIVQATLTFRRTTSDVSLIGEACFMELPGAGYPVKRYFILRKNKEEEKAE